MSRITRRSIIPVNQITPLTYRDGVTYIQLLTELSDYVKTVLHPSLQHTVDQLVADVEAQIDKAHDQYVEGVQEFQRIHDAFMSDVNASLIALNDGAVSDLVRDDTSRVGSALREIFTDRESFVELADLNEYRFSQLSQHVSEQVTTIGETVDQLGNRIDSRRKVAAHTEYNIHDGDVAALKSAIAQLPLDTTLTLPVDMEFTVSETLVIDRGVHIRGGVFRGVGNILKVTADGTCLEDMTVIGEGNQQIHHTSGTNAVLFTGERDRYISFCARNIRIRGVGYSGLRAMYARDFTVEHCDVQHFRYAGIAASSCVNGVITRNVIKHALADSSVGWNSYGVSVSNSTSLPIQYRSRNIEVSFNTIDDIPHWEGIDTHNGVNISMLHNTITGTRRGIALVANMTDPLSGPSECVVVGNHIDGSGASDEQFTSLIGITMAGSGDNTRKSDAIITDNVVVNTDTPVLFNHDRPERYTYNKCVVHSNVGDPGQNVAGTIHDTGWTGIANHMIFGGGVTSSSDYNIRIRVVSDHLGWTTYIRGGVARSNTSNLLFRVLDNMSHLVPGVTAFGGRQESHVIGTVRSSKSTGGSAVLYVQPDRRIRYGNPQGDVSGTLLVDAVMRSGISDLS